MPRLETHYRGLPIVAHDGANFGYRTTLLRFPQQGFSVICLCNLGTSNLRLPYQVADLYLKGQLAPDPAPAAVAKVDSRPFAGWYRNRESHAAYQFSAADGDIAALGTHFKLRDADHFVATPGAGNRF